MAVNTPASIPATNELSSHVQTEGSNMSISCGQSMGTLTMRPIIESTVISYDVNQPVDLNLWDRSFSTLSIFRTEKSLSKDAKNMATSLQRIRTYIK